MRGLTAFTLASLFTIVAAPVAWGQPAPATKPATQPLDRDALVRQRLQERIAAERAAGGGGAAPVAAPAGGGPGAPAGNGGGGGAPVAGGGGAPATGGGAPRPPATQPVLVTTQPGGGIILNFREADIDAVVNQLAEVAGFIVIKDVRLEGRITILSPKPVSQVEALQLLNSALKAKGYVAIQQDERQLKIMTWDRGKRAAIPVRQSKNIADIPKNDEIVTQIIPLRFADSVQLQRELSQMISADADFTSNASSNALIITDTSANIRRIAEIVNFLDTNLADAAEVKVFHLTYANAANAARLINDVFKTDDPTTAQQGQGGNRGGGLRGLFGGGGGGGGGLGGFFGGGGAGGGGGGRGGQPQTAKKPTKVQASSDDRTNSVVVSGPPDTLLVVEKVLKDLDQDPTITMDVFIYHLKNAQALNLQNVVNNIFNGNAGTLSRTSTSNTSRTGTSNRASGTGSSNRSSLGGGGGGGFGGGGGLGGGGGGFGGGGTGGGGFGGGGGGRGGGGFGGGGTGGGGFGGGGFGGGGRGFTGGTGGGGGAGGQGGISAADQVLAVADQDTNSLIITTNPKNFKRVQDVLDDLDRSTPQVLIKVLIAEVTHDNSRDLGAEFSVMNLRDNGQGPKLGTDFGIAQAQGGAVFRIVEGDFQAAIRALDTVGKLDVLSRPYILASDNQPANVTVGQEVPFITNTRTTDTGQTINTIQYQEIGIILDVTPHINPDGLVIMDVAPEISAVTGQTVPISETLTAPVFAIRSANTRVAIKNGQTIVIGGLMEDRKTETTQKVPLIGDIPVIGALFGRKQTTTTKTELLIFLTPHVASQPDQLRPMSREELRGTKLTPNAVEPGAFQDHIEGMQRGATSRPSEK